MPNNQTNKKKNYLKIKIPAYYLIYMSLDHGYLP